MLQITKSLKAVICTCLLLYIFTILDILKKKPPDKLRFEGNKSEYSDLKTLVGYSVEYQIAQDLNDAINCGLHFSSKDYNSSLLYTGKPTEEILHLNRDVGFYMMKSYFDHRLHPYIYIRTIALLPENTTIFCQVVTDSGDIVAHKATTTKIWAEGWGKSNMFTPFLISCLTTNNIKRHPLVSFVREPCSKPTQISIIQESVQATNKTNEIKMTICVKPLNYKRDISELLIEWIQLNTLLGASKIFIYYFYLPKETIKKLKPFIVSNLVELTRFRVPKGLHVGTLLSEQIWFKRKLEILAYNDCYYKNLHLTDFVIPLDVDEVIVPKRDNTWSMMLQRFLQKESNTDWKISLQNYSAFSVRNAYFFKIYPLNAKYDLPLKLPTVGNESLRMNLVKNSQSRFSRNLRSYRYSPNTESSKSFISVNGSLTIFNHFSFHQLKPGYRQILFPTSVVQLNHYRDSCDPILIENCGLFLDHVTYDNSLQRFRNVIKSSS